MKDAAIYDPASQAEWREWLSGNHLSTTWVWLVIYKKNSGKQNLNWTAAVDEALCFGWVDGRRKPLDDEKFIQFFCQRKANSTWSKINKVKVAYLIKNRQMLPAGLKCIHTAMQNGSWKVLDDVEDLVAPQDLEWAFEQQTGTKEYYSGLSNSVKKSILQWLKLCKTDKTRYKRIIEIVNSAKSHTVPDALKR
jgi:uncharacterized protein YdeI (YjbR/CyaY-like superfamily)